MKRRNEKGFTLVELTIVLAILGILAAVAVPNFITVRTAADTNACIANLAQIRTAKMQFGLTTNPRPAVTTTPTFAQLVPTFLEAQPVCPAGGQYTIGAINARPTCDQPNHVLPGTTTP